MDVMFQMGTAAEMLLVEEWAGDAVVGIGSAAIAGSAVHGA
jgi:hypothetical protein